MKTKTLFLLTAFIGPIAVSWHVLSNKIFFENDEISGIATHVRDGDTIEINGTAIRLDGLHAPELSEPLGSIAKAAMVRHVLGKIVTCTFIGDQTHDRIVGICYLNDEDIAAWLVSQGLARDCPHFSGGRYKKLEREPGASLPLPNYCL